MLIDKMNYEFLQNYVLQMNSKYCICDFKIVIEDLMHYMDYFPKSEIPEYFQQFELTENECKKIISLCNRRIKEINSRVGDKE